MSSRRREDWDEKKGVSNLRLDFWEKGKEVTGGGDRNLK